MSARHVITLVGTVVVALAAVAGTLTGGAEPVLGLDLRGGAAVVLQPVGPVDDPGKLDTAVGIIRRRVDALGVAEPEITRQGTSIIVQLPGVKDQQRALDIVGRTAQLQFRPVLATTERPADSLGDVTGTTTTAPPTTVGGTTTTTPDGDAGSAPSTTTPAEGATTTTTAPTEIQRPGVGERSDPDAIVQLPGEPRDGVVTLYTLGPVPEGLTGEAVTDADAVFGQQGPEWTVNVDLSADGLAAFNRVASDCFQGAASCPTGLVAIVLDDVVVSAPRVLSPTFDRGIVISGGGDGFSEREAKDLALVLRFGSLPVELAPQTVRTVSATLGNESLRAGLTAGAIGLVLVACYVIAYYRLLGLVAIGSLAVSGMLLWSIIAYLGETRGLALTLAGITGIVVSIGVAMDSNIVYYERIKEEVRNGRTLRSAAERGFSGAFSTIVKADVASIIGAALLWWLSIGPVRGFAFYLGVSTVLDLVASWFFMRPAVILLANSGLGRPGLLGVPTVAGAGPTGVSGDPVSVGAGVSR